jgi:hypothetical protein
MNSCPHAELAASAADAALSSFRQFKMKKMDKQKILLHLGECQRCAHIFMSTLMTLASCETDTLPESTEESKERAYKKVFGI